MSTGDDSVFKMVAELQKSGKSGSKKSDDVVTGLLGKMSEAYMQTKAENKELLANIEALEKDKSEMATEIEKLKSEQQKSPIVKTAQIGNSVGLPKKFENTKLVIKDDDQENDDPIMDEEALKMEEIEKFEKVKKQDRNRSVRAKMIEEELSRPRGHKKRRSRSRSSSRSPTRSRSRSRSKSRSYHNRRRSRSRSYDRDRERDRERRRQELEDRERERNKNRYKSNDINLDEWRPKTAENPVKIDPTLASIKEKLKQKQDWFLLWI